MCVLYTDDSILAGLDPTETDQDIKYIKDSKLNIKNGEDIEYFLGINIHRKPDATIHLNRPHIIDKILDDVKRQSQKTVLIQVQKYCRGIPTQKILTHHSTINQLSLS